MGISISPQRTRRTQRFNLFIHYRVKHRVSRNRIFIALFYLRREREELCVLRVLCGEVNSK
jgi:hypothetical protein